MHNLDEYLIQYDGEMFWLEETKNAERWFHPCEGDEDGSSSWFCRECGERLSDEYSDCECKFEE